MNYQELKNAIIEVIRTNGNEEITGEVLQFVLLEMVSSLGKDFQFAGVATPQTEIIERDDKVAWVLGAGTYENFGIPFTVAVDEIAFVLYNGTYRVQKVKTGVIVDDTLTRDGQNPVKGGAIYAEFEKLRAAGYLFAGVATPSLLPPANLTEKIFYLATQGGEYPNLDNITLQKGINIIRFDGTSWIGESLIAITDEVIDSNVSLITAAGVYNGLSGKVDKAEGMGLSQNSYTNTEKSKLGALPTAQELVQMLGGKQDVLTFDTTPTLNSQNPVTSDGIQRAIEAILVLIPSAASALNQLADKSFVNSTVATASATFRGTYNLVSDLSLAVTATHAQIAAALAGAVSGADNNDYAFVQIPTSAGTPTEIRVTERYKFNGETWAYEYDLNNSGFTASQWEAINSAITSALVTKLSALPTASELSTLFAGKQNVLTFDDVPVNGSNNPVKSDGLYDLFTAIDAKFPSDASSSNKLVAENRLASYVAGIIGALDASFDLTSTDGHVTFKMTQADGVITSVQILTRDIASAQALTTLGGQVSTNASDIAALQDLYNALQQSAPEIIQPSDTWPVANPSTTVIYRVIDRVNTPPEYYSDYMFKASDLTTPVLMATYNNAIDPRPKKGSANLVTSGGVFDNMGALDVSELNATENPQHTLAPYATLDAALAAIPADYQKGGMSIKFVCSPDNKYVQYRNMNQNWSTTESDWQGVDEKPSNSENLVKSIGVLNAISSMGMNVVGSDIKVNISPTTTINLGISLKAGTLYTFNLKCDGNNFNYQIKNGSTVLATIASNTNVNYRVQVNVDSLSLYFSSTATAGNGVFSIISSELNLNRINENVNTLNNNLNILDNFVSEHIGSDYHKTVTVSSGSTLDYFFDVNIPKNVPFTINMQSSGGFWTNDKLGELNAIDENNVEHQLDNTYDYKSYSRTFNVDFVCKKINLARGASALSSGTISVFVDAVREISEEIVFVDAINGSDTNDGTSDYPLKTFEKALLATGQDTTIVLRGDISEKLNIKTKLNQRSITVIGGSRKKNRVILGYKISEGTQYSGNVYYKDLTDINQYFSLQDYHIFQHEIPDSDTLISDVERHPLQRGREYRCESTMLLKAASIQDVVDNTKPSYFWQRDGETNNGRLYFKIVNGTVLANNPIYLPLGQKAIYGNDGSVKLSVVNVDAWYSQFDISKCNGAVIRNCSAKFAYAAGGFQWDNAVGVILDNCEASRTFSGTSTGDGFNAHSTESDDAEARHTTCMMIDCWSHDNNDDGYSDHERCECSIHGGLYEYNGKAGVTPAFGSHLVCYNTLSRKNLNGFLYTGVVTDGGKYGQMICYDCVAENNSQLFGFGVQGAGNSIILINCKSIQNLKGYYAYSGTTIEMTDCGFVGTSAENTRAKQAEDGATITVNNTTLVE